MLSFWAIIEVYAIPEQVANSLGVRDSFYFEASKRYGFKAIWILGAATALFLTSSTLLQIQATQSAKSELVYVPKYIIVGGTSSTTSQSETLDTSNIEEKLLHVKELNQVFAIICEGIQAVVGCLYRRNEDSQGVYFQYIEGYATMRPTNERAIFREGEGLIGQAAKSQKPIIITQVPSGYAVVHTGLGSASVSAIYEYPMRVNDVVVGVVELGFFATPALEQLDKLKSLADKYLVEFCRKSHAENG